MKVHRHRQFKFRDAQCTCITFIHGGALTYGRMKVYHKRKEIAYMRGFRGGVGLVAEFLTINRT